MVSKLIPEGDEIDLHLITWNEEHYKKKLAEDLSDIVTSVHDLGINLTYEFKSGHDRYIETDTGWKIVLGRGLDFFEKPDGNFNIAEIYQGKRRCRNCEITFIKSTVKK
jgi:ATP-dependent Lon protease